MKFTNRFFTVILTTLLFMACSPEDGVDGTDGVDGIDGVDGTDGADGADGEQGETGTANVIYSDWIDSEFDANVIATGTSFTIDAPSITDDIINDGVVLVFGRSTPAVITNDTDVYGLPVVFGANRQQTYYFRLEQAGELDITFASTVSGQSAGTPFFGAYRYVLIPGGTEAGNGIGGITTKNSEADYANMTYEEVTEIFGILD